jgi:hypothetical protein
VKASAASCRFSTTTLTAQPGRSPRVLLRVSWASQYRAILIACAAPAEPRSVRLAVTLLRQLLEFAGLDDIEMDAVLAVALPRLCALAATTLAQIATTGMARH